jgi:hypothetical protein
MVTLIVEAPQMERDTHDSRSNGLNEIDQHLITWKGYLAHDRALQELERLVLVCLWNNVGSSDCDPIASVFASVHRGYPACRRILHPHDDQYVSPSSKYTELHDMLCHKHPHGMTSPSF